MFILGIICCRGGSKGVLRKNTRLPQGKPLIAHTIQTTTSIELLKDCIISTDDLQIATIAQDYGANVPFIRPSELSTDTSSKWPVFIHALEQYEKLFGKSVDYIVDMDVTVPLKTAADINGAIAMALSDEKIDVVITGYESERNPYFNMMEIQPDGFASIVKKPEVPIVRRQDAPLVYSLTPAVYVIKKKALYQYSHWSEARCKIYPMPRERAIDIDTENDFVFVEYLIKQQNEVSKLI